MSPLWSVLVTIGQWAQTHQTLMVVVGGTVVAVLSLAHVVQRPLSRQRGPRP